MPNIASRKPVESPLPAADRRFPAPVWYDLAVRNLAALGLVLAVGCRAAPADKIAPPATAEPAPLIGAEARVHPVGELGHAHDYRMSVESVRDCPMEPPFAARPGFAKVGIEVVMAGTSTLEVPANPFYATLYDEADRSYSSTLAGCEPGIAPVRLSLGREARGFVTFEVPKSSRKLELHYAPLVIGPGPEELRFEVIR